MNLHPPPSPTPNLGELLQALRENLEAGLRLAKTGLAAAESAQEHDLEEFFRGCAQQLERAEGAASLLHVAAQGEGTAEQVSTASFASGDGANDAQVVPEGARGKAGNWPSA